MTTLVRADGAEDISFKCASSECFKLLNPHWGGLFVLWLWQWHASVCCVFQHPDEKRLEGLSKQLDWDVRTIQRWFRQRRNQEKPSTLARFCESMWESALFLSGHDLLLYCRKPIAGTSVRHENALKVHFTFIIWCISVWNRICIKKRCRMGLELIGCWKVDVTYQNDLCGWRVGNVIWEAEQVIIFG